MLDSVSVLIRAIRGKLPWLFMTLRSQSNSVVSSSFVPAGHRLGGGRTFRGQPLSSQQGPALSKRSASKGPVLSLSNGFTLVELLVGVTLSGMVMAAVLSSYIYLAGNLVRLTNQQTLETEARRTLAYFTRDVQMASAISGTPTATSLTLTIPLANGTTTVAYTYNSSAGTLTRTPASGTALVVLRNITSSGGLTFKYFDNLGNNYTSATLSAGSYLSGITQLSVEFNTQTGYATTGTQTQVYQIASNRMIVRNKPLLP